MFWCVRTDHNTSYFCALELGAAPPVPRSRVGHVWRIPEPTTLPQVGHCVRDDSYVPSCRGTLLIQVPICSDVTD